MKILGWNRGSEQYHWARPGIGTSFSINTAVLPPAWNQPFIEPRVEHGERYIGRPTVSDPYAVHFMGMQIADRQQAMRRMATKLSLHK